MHFSEEEIESVLTRWRRIRRRPSRDPAIAVLAGHLDFTMEPPGLSSITDSYQLRLVLPLAPMGVMPKVYESGGRIPHDPDNHVYPDGGLCLGSPLRLLQVLGIDPSLERFITQCVVPFLYAASWREQGGIGFPFNELAHGSAGLVDDYERLFSLQGRSKVLATLDLLAVRKRVANKLWCPCGCRLRLGRCQFRLSLSEWRALAPRWVYGHQANFIREQMPAKKRQVALVVNGIASTYTNNVPKLSAW